MDKVSSMLPRLEQPGSNLPPGSMFSADSIFNFSNMDSSFYTCLQQTVQLLHVVPIFHFSATTTLNGTSAWWLVLADCFGCLIFLLFY